MSNIDLSRAVWRKSSRSSDQGQCVELAQNVSGVGAVRDSKNPDRAALMFTPDQLRGFLTLVKSGKLDL